MSKTFPQADLVVVLAVARSGVNAAGTGFEGDVLAEEDDGVAIVEGVLAPLVVKDIGLEGGDYRAFHAGCFLKALLQPVSHDEDLGSRFQCHIIELGMKRYCKVGRNGPGGGGPDDERHVFSRQRRNGGGHIILQRKLHEHRRRFVVGVLHLSLGQGRHAG